MAISREAQRLLDAGTSLDRLHQVGQYEAKVLQRVEGHISEHGVSADTYELRSEYGNALEDTIEAAQELRRRTELAEDDTTRQNRILGIE